MGNFNVKTKTGTPIFSLNGTTTDAMLAHDLTVTNDLAVAVDTSIGGVLSVTNSISAASLGITNGISCDSVYANGNISAGSFTDRTPFYEGDALEAIRNIAGIAGELDHSTLPEFVIVDNEFRDVGAMVTVLTVAIQQLLTKVEEQQAIIDELRKG